MGALCFVVVPVEAVQVQLVNSWWEQVLPVAALFFSLFSIALTLLFRYFDRLKLAVSAEWTSVATSGMQPFTGLDRVTVEVTNRSRSAATEITVLSLKTDEQRTLGQLIHQRWQADSDLPITLAPGQSASISYSAERLGEMLNNRAARVKWVQGIAVCGHKTVLGKQNRDLVTRLRAYAIENPAPV
jgi:hypothetical protein